MAIEILKDIINNFSPEEFIHFFRLKNSYFKPYNELVHHYDDDNFKDCLFIGEIPFDNAQRVGIYAFKIRDSLTERSGKKKQYEKGKRILKETNTDAGLFIFYDEKGNFRFSLIYTEYLGTRRRFSYFKRYTYFVSPSLTNKTFLEQIGKGDFSSLEKIKEAFSVEPVTKQFYEEIQNWYFWAMDKVKFPEDYKYSEDPEKDREIRTATNLIRLITRIIFIWFIKERGLIPEILFDKDNLSKIVKDFAKPGGFNYYNAILQNLFFATLNQKMGERRFARDDGYPANKKEYGVKTLFRYKDKFLISERDVLNLFKEIPFLNGGLFDCLDKEDETGKVIYIDGFSRNPKKQAIIPDYLFFQQEEIRVDLSAYGLGSNRRARGLVEILKSYNFTIDENTPVDQEVALDPELLGKVFENLLACYNPETATTARKATGSYYTPREIVDYMVDESLLEYLVVEASGFGETNKVVEASGFAETNKVTEASGFGDLYKIHYGKYGKLPHIHQQNAWYFITFRLVDALPKEKIEQIIKEREVWLAKHKDRLDNLTEEEKKEYYRLFSERIENWLNAGYGSCILRDEKIAKIVAEALLYFNGKRYELAEWVIMPNHVHMLIKPLAECNLSEILHSLKSYTAHKINELTGNKGQVWMHESYDHVVRNERAFEAIRNYIRQNPEKAGIKIPDCCCSWRSVAEPSRFGNVTEPTTIRSDLRSEDASTTLSRSGDASITLSRSGDASTTLSRSEDASTTIEKLRLLLSYSEEVPELSEEEKQKIISAIDKIKILDPACGSGAFPMGILHKLVHILQKIDPNNKHWYELQYQKAIKASEEVFKERDKAEREEMLKEINEAFDESINYPDYARKLYLIENCIYGVDIQPIAIQISKLRFFISLVLDQRVDKTKENFGIRALPNLETKFVAANTLIGLEKPQQLAFRNIDIINKEEELKRLRHKYFTAKTRTEKLRLQKKDREIREEIARLLINDGWREQTANKIASFDLFDQNASADWFDPEWMFGIVIEPSRFGDAVIEPSRFGDAVIEPSRFGDAVVEPSRFENTGFDIVIGNPPYIQLQKSINNSQKYADLYKNQGYEVFDRTGDIYCLFYEKGLQLLKQGGILAYITSNKWMRAGYGEKLREFFIKHNPLKLVDLGPDVFENATVDTSILIIQKSRNQNQLKAVTLQKKIEKIYPKD